jgi:phosphotransferase system HPr-like phosphotransfer protein
MNEITLHKRELDAIVTFVSKYPSSVDYINITVDSSSGIGSIVKVSVKTVTNGDMVEITKTITDESSW